MSISAELNADVNKVARTATFMIDQRLVLQTPVDTGEARGSWQVSVGKPITTDNDVQDKTGSLTLSKNRAIIESSKTITYPTFYIRSNKPYIERLNNGYSAQAPSNFADKAITEGLNDVQSITL
jgi:hypothetical protein